MARFYLTQAELHVIKTSCRSEGEFFSSLVPPFLTLQISRFPPMPPSNFKPRVIYLENVQSSA